VLRAQKTPLVTFKSTKLPLVPLALAIKTQKFFPLKKKSHVSDRFLQKKK